jgi:hypothetical protein
MLDREALPLPEDPALAEAATSLNAAGHWATIVDPLWQIVYMTDDLRLTYGGQLDPVAVPLGAHFLGPRPFAPTSSTARSCSVRALRSRARPRAQVGRNS